MDTRLWLIVAFGGCLLCAATWLSSRWWYGRKLQAANLRFQKIDKARHFSIQQTLQARKQIEALQRDLAAQQEVLTQAQIGRQRSRHMEEVLKAAADAEAAAEAEAQAGALALRPAHGFADTQPMA